MSNWIIYADGDVYQYQIGEQYWLLKCNVACAPVSLQETTWGRVKAGQR